MEEKLVECVPNFSEGRDNEVIRQITDTIKRVNGVTLLDVDPGCDMNRTVVTFIGSPERVKEAAFEVIKKASELIDMSRHHGSHPRMGATDVCPFVPVSGVTVEECIELAKELGKRVGDELGIPVYLYEYAAQKPERKNLAIIRQGEYEGLKDKLNDPEWKPDFGPAKFNPRSGATVIGVREFLIAYNINLNTRDVKIANDIAFTIREKGRSARRSGEILRYKESSYPCGSCDFEGKTIQQTGEHCQKEHEYDLRELLMLNEINPDAPEGSPVKIPGKFTHCKAIGWFVPKYDRDQISINLTNYKVTPMHDVIEEVRRLALERGIVVTGSEVVGMVPYPALLETGKYYLKRQGRPTGIPDKDILETAVQSLGLRDVGSFIIEERVIGLPKLAENALVSMKISDFVAEVSRETPAPGGGSVAALAGALGAGLVSMVSTLTAYKTGNAEIDDKLNTAAEQCQEVIQALVKTIDDDTVAFNAYREALRLPDKTEEQKKAKKTAVQNAITNAASIPMQTAELSLKALKASEIAAEYGNVNAISDVGTGAYTAYAGFMGGIYNVLINIKSIDDARYKTKMEQTCADLKRQAQSLLEQVESIVENELKAVK